MYRYQPKVQVRVWNNLLRHYTQWSIISHGFEWWVWVFKIGLPGGTNLGKQVIWVNLLVEDKNIYLFIYIYLYTCHICPAAQACLQGASLLVFFLIVIVDIYQWVCRNILRVTEIEGRWESKHVMIMIHAVLQGHEDHWFIGFDAFLSLYIYI